MIRIGARHLCALSVCGTMGMSAGCATLGALGQGRDAQSGPMMLDGVVIRSGPDPDTGLEIYDAAQLFHLAGEAERKGQRARAKKLYSKLIGEFGRGAYWANAHFNLGLLHEKDGRFDLAVALYEKIVDLHKYEPYLG